MTRIRIESNADPQYWYAEVSMVSMVHKKKHIYLEYHSVCPLVRIGNPHPLSRKLVPPPGTKGGGVHTRLQLRGWGGPNSDDGSTVWWGTFCRALSCARHGWGEAGLQSCLLLLPFYAGGRVSFLSPLFYPLIWILSAFFSFWNWITNGSELSLPFSLQMHYIYTEVRISRYAYILPVNSPPPPLKQKVTKSSKKSTNKTSLYFTHT